MSPADAYQRDVIQGLERAVDAARLEGREQGRAQALAWLRAQLRLPTGPLRAEESAWGSEVADAIDDLLLQAELALGGDGRSLRRGMLLEAGLPAERARALAAHSWSELWAALSPAEIAGLRAAVERERAELEGR